MSARNPQKLGVSQTPEVVRSVVNTTTPGEALVTSVVYGQGLSGSYTGVDAGTGDVVLSLPVIPSSAGRTFTTVVIDNHGRVVGGTEGSLQGDYVLNSPASRQSGGFLLDHGDVTTLEVFVLNAVTINAGTIHATTPLGVASGGTGASTVNQHFAFLGPLTSNGAPSFRSLDALDLPDYPFSRITPHPTTLSGYGISDAYDKATSDSRYAASAHTHTAYELVIQSGSTAQYYRGDKTWHNLTTDVVQETSTKKFYTDAYSRSALSLAIGTANLTYDANVGVFGFSGTPTFTQVSITQAPASASSATNKQYVDAAFNSIIQRTPRIDTFVVTSASQLTYTLTRTPSPGSMIISLNGLVCNSDTTLTGAQVIFNADVALTPSDTITATYWY